MIDWGQFDANGTNYDTIYNISNDDEQQDTRDKNQTGVLRHMLAQIGPGMTMQNLSLPTYMLERRSLLEVYADSFAHPEELIDAAYQNTPEKRFLSVLKYYLNSFYPARKSVHPKKPYNPILGETFRCRWTLPGTNPASTTGCRTRGGPFPGSSTNQMTFIAEQVSHHPPVSAYYVEHPDSGVSCTMHFYTKLRVAGIVSLGVENIGKAAVRLRNHKETYIATFPDALAHNLLGTPWFEFAGKVQLHCEKTGYRAEIDFLPKPFFRGKAHQIHGHVFLAGQDDAIMQLKGEWNGQIYLKRSGDTDYQLFTNVRQKPCVRKECVPVMEQDDRESRKLWRHVTAALFNKNFDIASQAKRHIEQRQRGEQAQRERLGLQWETRHFTRIGDGSPTDEWRYRNALEQRPTRDGP